jgi:hypothetical protein
MTRATKIAGRVVLILLGLTLIFGTISMCIIWSGLDSRSNMDDITGWLAVLTGALSPLALLVFLILRIFHRTKVPAGDVPLNIR